MDWKRSIIYVLDVFIGIYLVLAMTSFIKPDEKADICKSININIQKETTDGFLTESEVMRLLRKSKLTLVSQPMSSINTRQIEEILEGNDLIDNAECYKAVNGVLCINIVQRIPIVRVMSNKGEDYYVDNHNEVMQHNNYTCNLLVATGNISKQYASKSLSSVVRQIQENDFWSNQIVQLNVLDDRSIEAIPRVGNHVIYLGQPTGINKKLERLRKFYIYGLSQTGWNRYSRISVEFDNQIICKRNKVKK